MESSRQWAPQSHKSCAAPPLTVISRTVGPASELWSGQAEIGPTGPIIIQQLTYQTPRASTRPDLSFDDTISRPLSL